MQNVNVQNVGDITIETHPRLYKLVYRFYEAGYERKRYPRPLGKVQRSLRPVLRHVYEEGRMNSQGNWGV